MIFSQIFLRKKSAPTSRKRPRRVKSELEVQLELTLSKQREAARKAAELQREIDEVPKKLKRLEENERRRISDRASKTPTMREPGRPRSKLHSVTEGVPMTRAQKRMLRNRLMLLSAVLVGFLFLLWRTVR